eukprot:scaffold70725_cov68-Phaeocystis_antarctica.AAC.6
MASGNASEKPAMGKGRRRRSPRNNDPAKKWHQCDLHVRQKEPAPNAEMRCTTPEVVRAPPNTSSNTP